MGTRSKRGSKPSKAGGFRKSRGSVEYEKRATRLVLPKEVLRKLVEEYAERVRDGINSQLGYDRLSIKLLMDNGDDSVDILFTDTDAPQDSDLYLGWEQGVDADATIDMLLSGEYEAVNREAVE